MERSLRIPRECPTDRVERKRFEIIFFRQTLAGVVKRSMGNRDRLHGRTDQKARAPAAGGGGQPFGRVRAPASPIARRPAASVDEFRGGRTRRRNQGEDNSAASQEPIVHARPVGRAAPRRSVEKYAERSTPALRAGLPAVGQKSWSNRGSV